jgi:cellulose synthase/poly-beta-1,6-N-acetylglucosamine synthase-like glycosyltransferase
VTEKEQKSNSLRITKILMFVCSITAIVLLFYLSTIGVISNNAYLGGGFGIVIAVAIINYALIRIYGNKQPKRLA